MSKEVLKSIKEENILISGKAKTVYKTENSEEVLVYYRDSATAFNGVKKAEVDSKGLLNNKISCFIFEYLKENGVETHLIEKLDERTQLCKKVDIVPLEYICRNKIAGSMAKRVGIEDGTDIEEPIFEICYKNDEYGDPLLNDYHAVAMKLITKENLKTTYEKLGQINSLLIDLFKKANITLVDFKIEFGIDSKGNILLADEISPDCCRLWDMDTNKRLDKDVFRLDLGEIATTYQVVVDRLGIK